MSSSSTSARASSPAAPCRASTESGDDAAKSEENMRKRFAFGWIVALTWAAVPAAEKTWPAPVAPAVPEADGYVAVPGAVVPPVKSRTYKAVFDATQAAGDPKQLLPALNMLGSELN